MTRPRHQERTRRECASASSEAPAHKHPPAIRPDLHRRARRRHQDQETRSALAYTSRRVRTDLHHALAPLLSKARRRMPKLGPNRGHLTRTAEVRQGHRFWAPFCWEPDPTPGRKGDCSRCRARAARAQLYSGGCHAKRWPPDPSVLATAHLRHREGASDAVRYRGSPEGRGDSQIGQGSHHRLDARPRPPLESRPVVDIPEQ
jgi:hypothetical protein